VSEWWSEVRLVRIPKGTVLKRIIFWVNENNLLYYVKRLELVNKEFWCG